MPKSLLSFPRINAPGQIWRANLDKCPPLLYPHPPFSSLTALNFPDSLRAKNPVEIFVYGEKEKAFASFRAVTFAFPSLLQVTKDLTPHPPHSSQRAFKYLGHGREEGKKGEELVNQVSGGHISMSPLPPPVFPQARYKKERGRINSGAIVAGQIRQISRKSGKLFSFLHVGQIARILLVGKLGQSASPPTSNFFLELI